MKLKIPPAIVALGIAGVMWLVAQNFDPEWAIFNGVRWIGLIFAGAGGGIGLLGLVQFYKKSTSINPHKPRNASRLVTDGIYGISRNPMYVGLLLILIGYGWFLGNILAFAVTALFVVYMNRFQIIPEEEVMEEKFGEEFRKYKSSVHRWL